MIFNILHWVFIYGYIYLGENFNILHGYLKKKKKKIGAIFIVLTLEVPTCDYVNLCNYQS